MKDRMLRLACSTGIRSINPGRPIPPRVVGFHKTGAYSTPVTLQRRCIQGNIHTMPETSYPPVDSLAWDRVELTEEQKPTTHKNRRYRLLKLPNKMRAVLISDEKCDRASVSVSVHVGSLCEKPYQTDGLAHFLEHMLFLGTEKYPEEESYKKFLTKNGGGCNASTSDEWTRYYLYVSPSCLDEAVDRIAQFFLAPLMDPSCTDREMNAVDSEHRKNLQNDSRRAMQVFRMEADEKHALHHFRTGCLETLKKEGIRDILLNLHKDFYSANLMGVAIFGKESLDELETMVRSRFEAVVNKDAKLPAFGWAFSRYSNRLNILANQVLDSQGKVAKQLTPQEKETSHLPTIVYVEPIKEERYFDFQFFTPEQDAELWRLKTDEFWSHIFGYEGKGSLLSFLKSENLATGLSAGMYYDGAGTGVFHIRVNITNERGIPNLQLIGESLFKYILLIRYQVVKQYWTACAEGAKSRLQEIWQENSDLGKLRFRYRPLSGSVEAVQAASRNVVLYPPEEILSAASSLYDFSPLKILEFFEYLRLDNLRLVVFHKDATRKSQLETHTEQFFGATYTQNTRLREHLKGTYNAWDAIDVLNDDTKLDGFESHEDLRSKVSIPEDFALLPRNEFIPTDFSLKEINPTDFSGSDGLLDNKRAIKSVHSDGSSVKGPADSEEQLFELKPQVKDKQRSNYRIFLKSTIFPYEEPRAYLKVNIHSDFVVRSLESYCRAVLFTSVCEEYMNESLYDCEMCALDYGLSCSMTGTINIYCGGYNDKLLVLFEKLVDFLANFCDEDRLKANPKDREKVQAALDTVLERKSKSWYNGAFKKQPIEMAGEMIGEEISENDYPLTDMYQWLEQAKEANKKKGAGEGGDGYDPLSVSNILQNVSTDIFAGGYAAFGEVLLEGNVSATDGQKVDEILQKHLPLNVHCPDVNLDLIPACKRGVKTLTKDSRIIQPTRNFNDPNSACLLYLQTGAYVDRDVNVLSAEASQETLERNRELIRVRTLNFLLCQFLGQPFFADLRTKQQLGYLVSAGAAFVHGMTGVVFRVQSANTKSPQIEERIRTFFDSFRDDVLLGKKEEFPEFIKGAVAKLSEKPKRLSGEFSAHWTELALRSYRFDWKATSIDILQKLTWEELIAYVDNVFLAAPKLWIHIVGPERVGENQLGLSDEELESLGKAEVHKSAGFVQYINNRRD